MNMNQFTLIILAGGIGSRLKGTEPYPKPLVKIQGKRSFLSYLIESYSATSCFSKYIILISDRESDYINWHKNQKNNSSIRIFNEGIRTGRTGAIKSYSKQYPLLDKTLYFIANGDTLLPNISSSDIYKAIIGSSDSIPVAFVSEPDPLRDDYMGLPSPDNVNSHNLNTGLFCATGSWFNSIMSVDSRYEDIDYYLFKRTNHSFLTIPIKPPIIDIGTPERLFEFRKTFNQ